MISYLPQDGQPGAVQLFRFIDCLLLREPEISAHLQEYLADESVELPVALKGMLNFASPDSMPGQRTLSNCCYSC